MQTAILELSRQLDLELEQIKSTLAEVTVAHSDPQIHELTTIKGGPFTGYAVLNNDHVAIAYYSGPAGTRVSEHAHEDSVEYILVVKGVVRLTQPSRKDITGPGGMIVIPKNAPHILDIIHDAEIVVSIIPADPAMPKT